VHDLGRGSRRLPRLTRDIDQDLLVSAFDELGLPWIWLELERLFAEGDRVDQMPDGIVEIFVLVGVTTRRAAYQSPAYQLV
jgi:hypothetical protein